ncbi:response regulator transcription factor [Ktedonosporobacter rubrisoli]|uniref:Response regulator transcription factor n=1 Tax=Ktedonosporobacter rubrisoli TaxID=2509675 RepID=A0A4P6JZ69_KTERU|nr:response regulator transcription factor [Ktedonosporobacter rubrisoli]QBD80750.1 response regulator transcription factor [Ktedonosporobacter rubrisoli]
MTKAIRILIVDDQTLVREGFRKLLEMEADFEIVDTAHDGEDSLAIIERLAAQQRPPNVVLMDIRMPRMNGITATKQIKARWPNVHIVILTTFDDVELIHAGLHAGALGYLLKDATSEQLTATIRTAAQGQTLLQPDIAHKVFATLTAENRGRRSIAQELPPLGTRSSDVEHLTEREREILALVARGEPNKQIAEELFLAEGTVKNHLSSILSKLGVRDRTQAALKARELGLT